MEHSKFRFYVANASFQFQVFQNIVMRGPSTSILEMDIHLNSGCLTFALPAGLEF